MNHRRLHLQLLAVALIWGAAWAWAKIITREVLPLTAGLTRLTLAALLLLAWLYRCDRFAELRQLRSGQLLKLALAALVGFFGYAVCFVLGIKNTSATNATIIITLNSPATMFGAVLIFREHINRAIGVGMACALAGTVLAITRGDLANLSAVGRGDYFVFGCVLCFSAFTLFAKTFLRGLSSRLVVTISTVLAALALLPVQWALEGAAGFRSLFNASPWAALHMALIVGLSTVLGYIWYFQGVQGLGAVRAAVYNVLVPLFGIGYSLLFLNEPGHWTLLPGVGLTVAGLALINHGQRQLVPH